MHIIDSAPHAITAKEGSCGCAGIYTFPFSLELYVEVFEACGSLDKLENFTRCYFFLCVNTYITAININMAVYCHKYKYGINIFFYYTVKMELIFTVYLIIKKRLQRNKTSFFLIIYIS